MRDEWEKKENEWKNEKENIKKGMDVIYEKLDELEGRKIDEKVENRLEELEWMIEMREREERRRNIVIKKLEIEGDNVEETVKKLLKSINVERTLETVKRVGRTDKEGRSTVIVRMEKEEDKGYVMRKKAELKGRKEIIENDMTRKERNIQSEIRTMAEKIRGEGKRVKIGYKKIWINDEVWIWDERDRMLKNGKKSKNGSKGGNLEML